MDDRYLVVTSDPITFVTDQLGYYGVHVNANDIATRGAIPSWFLVTLLLPEALTDKEMVEGIFSQLHQACQELDISLIGGHTEVTFDLDRPVLAGHMLGEVGKNGLVTTGGAVPGDLVLLTQGICIEGISIIARVKEKELRKKGYSEEWIQKARNFLFDPGISVVKGALTACRAGKINSMHDPTEGGVATALHELARAAGVGLLIEEDRIPLFPEMETLCREYALDPLGTISSGTLLITLPSEETGNILDSLEEAGIRANIIGKVLADKEKLLLKRNHDLHPLPFFERDEITKIL
jgi:hydrogenase maturation factor